jgi:CheY-like chemotaxis protein
MVEADATQLHQAILNLCINARDAMPKGGNLTISSERITGKQLRKRFADAAAQEYIQVSVSDDGIGMDEATKARIFEPFFTTKEIGKGTGLGLSVVFGVVRSHHGFVDVHSAPGRGTTFTLYFPVRTEKTEVIAETSKDENDIPGGNETILVVEDEEALQSLLKTFLEEKGYEVLTASNGLEAVERFQENKDRVALVFSDLGLPKLNGLDAFHRMKKIKPDIKTIFASGFIEPFEREEVRRMGVGEFLQKPYNPIQILRTVRNVLDSQ